MSVTVIALAPLATRPPLAGLVVRPMAPSDGAALAGAVAALSPQSRYLRFMSPKPHLTPGDVAALTDLDHHAREALVAFEAATGAWAAVARYATFPEDPSTADVAITVGDLWHGRGVGSALLGQLIERARQEGIARLHATTLAVNVPARRLLHRHGFRAAGWDGAALELQRLLAV